MTFVLFCIVLYIFAFYNFDNANYFVLFLSFVLSGYFKTMSVYDFKNQNEDLKKKNTQIYRYTLQIGGCQRWEVEDGR